LIFIPHYQKSSIEFANSFYIMGLKYNFAPVKKVLCISNLNKLSIHFMRKIRFTFFCLLLTTFFVQAQDQHFTQFYASPLTLNPALTGAFNGKYRANAIYRDQWRNALDDPYVTFSSAIDVRFDVELDSRYKDAFAVGLMFFNDDVSSVDFSTNQIAISGAFHKGIDFDKTQFLSVGFQGALAQRNINYENLIFDDQFNEIDAFDFATGEDLPENNFTFSDLSVGINYTYAPAHQTSFFAGFAMHHVLQPQVTFYSPENNGDSKLFTKYSGQLSASIPLTDLVSISPRFLIASQGSHLEMNTGANIRVQLNDFGSTSFHLGSWVRPVGNDDDSISLDAIVLMAGIEINAVVVGLSYDLNLSNISTARQGAFELSITYLGESDDDSIMCPKF
jgi:type IX secretion system PorP/SprF family membrane protein